MQSKTPKFSKKLKEILNGLEPCKKTCGECQKEFEIMVEDIEFYKKLQVPPPTLCPDCRVKRRMSFYNIKTLYKRKCDKCGDKTLSIFDDKVQFPVYCPKCWWADDWDATEYAQEVDFSKPFLNQVDELMSMVPRFALDVDYQRDINSPYVSACGPMKNSYVVFLGSDCEDTFYSMEVDRVKSSMDCTNVSESENCFNSLSCDQCYNIFNSYRCSDSMDIYFSRNLRSCSDCFGCVNLKNKKYYIFNKSYTKESYFSKLKEFTLGSYESNKILKKKFTKFSLKFPFKFANGIKNQNVSGDSIFFSKNVRQSFLVIEGENIKYSQLLGMAKSKDCQDYTSWGQNAEQVYESINSGDGINNIKFTIGAYQSYNVQYSNDVLFSNDIFGCAFIRKKSYCILNKPYSKEEYFKMVEKIKKHMNKMPYVDKQGREYKYGEFFPPELSPFAYNETIAQEYFPLTKEEASAQGYRWKEPKKKNYKITLEAKDLPDHIDDVSHFAGATRDGDDSILKEVIGCATKEENRELSNCTTAFKIIPKELEFYKKMNIPLPRYCPNCRHHERLKNRNPLKLYKRTCMKEGCNTEFETTYAPDRKEIVYCGECYQQEVV